MDSETLQLLAQLNILTTEQFTTLSALDQADVDELSGINAELLARAREMIEQHNSGDGTPLQRENQVAAIEAVVATGEAVSAEILRRPEHRSQVASSFADIRRSLQPPARPSIGAVARNRPADRAPAPNPVGAAVTITAAGDVPGFAGNAEIEPSAIGEAFANKVHAVLAGGKRRVGRYPVATLRLEYPDERQLDGNEGANMAKIEAVTAPSAIVAAGGICAPVAASYDLASISSDERPIRDGLARFGAERGGIRFIEPPRLANVGNATVIWTEANDTTPSDPTTKPCLRITCGDATEVLVDAVTKCVEVGNFSRRTFPEQFATWWELVSANHAREAENNLWDQMVTNSTVVDAGQWIGATRDLLAALDRAIAAYRFRHRMGTNSRLRFVAPTWLRDMFRADLVRQVAGDNTYAVTDEQIAGWFNVRGVNVTWTPDAGSQAFTGTQGVGDLIGWPDTVRGLLFHEGAHLFLDGGELNFGMEIRDSDLNSTNDVQAFTETFEASAFVGVESLAIDFNVCPDGSSSAAIDIAGTICSAGS